MSKSKHSEAEMIGALKQLEAGRKTEDVAREVGQPVRGAAEDHRLADRVQPGTAAQQFGIPDAGPVRTPSSRAPVAYGSLRAAARPSSRAGRAERYRECRMIHRVEIGGRSVLLSPLCGFAAALLLISRPSPSTVGKIVAAEVL